MAEEVVFDFTKPAELTPAVEASDKASSGVSVDATTFTAGDIKLAVDAAASTNGCKLWTGTSAYDLRAYNGTKLTLTAPAGQPIVKVILGGSDVKKAKFGETEIATGIWTGSETELVVTATGTLKINTVTVIYGEEAPADPEYTSIADLKAAATSSAVPVSYKFTGLTVTGVAKKNNNYSVYVTDGTEGMLFYGTNEPNVKKGDKINGTLTGELIQFRTLTEIQAADYSAVTVASSNNEVNPVVVALSTLKNNETKAYENLFVRLEKIAFDAEALASGNINMVDAEGTALALRDNFNVLGDFIFKTGKEYNVNGYVAYYNGTPQMYVMSADDVELITNLIDPETAWNAEVAAQEPGKTFVPNTFTTLSDGARTFTSSNEKVATVDADGNVTFTGYGFATITLHTAETDTYLESQASYTLYNIKGEGTLENPYIATDLGFYNGKVKEQVWVKGTILGSYGNGGVIADASASNLALGTEEFFVPVQLGTKPEEAATVRGALNPKDNPENVGKEVYILGQIETYFSTAGLKNTVDYSWDGQQVTTAIGGVEADNAGNKAAVYTIDGRRADKAVRGLYIIGGKKVYVK